MTGASETVELGGYSVTASGPIDTRGMFGEGTGDSAAVVTGYGVVIHLGGTSSSSPPGVPPSASPDPASSSSGTR